MIYFFIVMFVQIIFESFPVSSSGHVTLITRIYEHYYLKDIFISPPFFYAWFHSTHLVTAAIVALFFYQHWFFLLANVWRTWKIIAKLLVLTFVADVVTVAWYLFFHYYPLELSLTFGFCTTFFLLLSLVFVSRSKHKRAFNVSDALLLGMVQGVTLLPGISRFAATFVASRWLGYSNEQAFQLSWMIQWPLVLVASVVGFYDLYSSNLVLFYYSPVMLIGMMGAAIISYYGLCFVYWYACENKFWKFAYYMLVPIVLAVVV